MVTQTRVQIGIVGKPNAGKSTFFAAATMKDVKISPTPFTTIDPNVGVGYVRIDDCPCRSVKCNPRSYTVAEGVCYAPVELIDVAGLVPGAWQGRGLGNQFLDHLRRAPALIHVVDASGSTDEEGRLVKPGTHDPVRDVEFLEREVDMWMASIVRRDWDKVVRLVEFSKRNIAEVLLERLAGLGMSRGGVEKALEESGLAKKPPSRWEDADFYKFAHLARSFSKPIVIAANKVDLPEGEEGYKKLREAYPNRVIIPTSAEAELALRRAAAKGLVRYKPGDGQFEITGQVTPQQKAVLERIADVLKKWGGTGVVQAVNAAVFNALQYVAVYPVEDEKRLSDREGNVLPDLLLVPRTYTARDVAYAIHTELGERFVAALDARSGRRLASDEPVTHGLIVKIVAR
ncbi:redox-regulated ATPase YchF [Pyrobaculum sp. 3827-6]|uniref:redox-regulated ATPase YchF n=1 Tax=Pyrobaculum sp. 3827-6 TaxID=2983604 RepID=UPI0021DA2E7C|nr:redox-regulated ATPase YchF [Pyrobaculum sp. 3827-6]MCU7787265.1 redox-regulated ATPase YchF [Pyrobaculum sp. 3827-6]